MTHCLCYLLPGMIGSLFIVAFIIHISWSSCRSVAYGPSRFTAHIRCVGFGSANCKFPPTTQQQQQQRAQQSLRRSAGAETGGVSGPADCSEKPIMWSTWSGSRHRVSGHWGDGDDVVSDLPSLLEYFCTRLKVLVVVQKLLLSNVLPI